MTPIRRHAPFDGIALRAVDAESDTGDESLRFQGHAAVFRQPTLIGSRQWGFVEWIEPGAFRDVLNDDVRYLFNHDGMPMARTTNDTLKLSEDKVGLVAEAELAPISLSRDLAVLIERGDVTQMSFAFYVGEQVSGMIPEKDDDPGDDARAAGITKLPKGLDRYAGMPYIAITRMDRLFDVSPVTYPAYEGTDVEKVSATDEALIRSLHAEYSALRTGFPVPDRKPYVYPYDRETFAVK